MSGYKSFAVVGAGNIGSVLIDELLEQKASGAVSFVVVLTRTAEGNDALAEKGPIPVVVDYNSSASLQSALRGIDVVIPTLPVWGLPTQAALGDAAKVVGVKLFVPSEFGGDTLSATEGQFGLKHAQRAMLEEIGLSWAVFFNGPFADWVPRQPMLGFDLDQGKIEIGGSGESLVSFTSRKDVARYLVHVIQTLPPSKLHNRVFRIEGERTSFNKIFEPEYQARTGKKLDITRIPIPKLEANVKQNPKTSSPSCS